MNYLQFEKSPAEKKHLKMMIRRITGINMHPEQMFPVRRKMQVKFMHNLMNKQKLKKFRTFSWRKMQKSKATN